MRLPLRSLRRSFAATIALCIQYTVGYISFSRWRLTWPRHWSTHLSAAASTTATLYCMASQTANHSDCSLRRTERHGWWLALGDRNTSYRFWSRSIGCQFASASNSSWQRLCTSVWTICAGVTEICLPWKYPRGRWIIRDKIAPMPGRYRPC